MKVVHCYFIDKYTFSSLNTSYIQNSKRKLCSVRDILDCYWLAATFNEESICFSHYHEVMVCTCFPHYWPFVRGIQHWSMASPHEHPVMGSFDVFFVIRMSVLLKKPSCSGLFEMQENLWEIIVVYWYMYHSVLLWRFEILPKYSIKIPHSTWRSDMGCIMCSTIYFDLTLWHYLL